MNYLNRQASGFAAEIWDTIDSTVVAAAQDVLTARRFLDVDGPYGVGLTSLEVGTDDFCRAPKDDEAGAILSRAVSVPMIRKQFDLSIRRLAASEQFEQPMDLAAAEDAAEAVAAREEEFIYYGNPEFGLHGLLNAPQSATHKCGDWSDVEQVLNDVLAAIDHLDNAGFRGPYALALAPHLYNGLFRRYAGSDLLQVEHLSRLCAKGVFKAPIDGGVVLDPRVGKVVVGQDFAVGYQATDGVHHQLYVSESCVLKLESPSAVCRLAVGQKRKQ